MKFSSVRYCIIFLVIIVVDVAYPLETRQGIIRRVQSIVCTNDCGNFYLEPDPGDDFTYLKGNISSYVDQHVEVTGFRASCGGCESFIVTEVELLPIVEVNNLLSETPLAFRLNQNFPNPFNPATAIAFTLPSEGIASLKIFNILGHEVKSLVEGRQKAGLYEVRWDATSKPSGVYFYRLSFVGINGAYFVQTKKMLYL
ncbi:MAG: T9SS type A sorting domain-containing protein [Ignavibacteriae bacterium]|nr:T9SS type A sorting domain-containing protein [Ignavibacteriota bacterium]